MVKTTQYTSDTQAFRNAYEQTLDRVGKTHTITRYTITTDGLGNTITTTATTFDVKGDFQIITNTEEIEKLGMEGTGNAKFFAKISTMLSYDDELTYNGDIWKFRRRLDDDDIKGVAVAQSWLLQRIDG